MVNYRKRTCSCWKTHFYFISEIIKKNKNKIAPFFPIRNVNLIAYCHVFGDGGGFGCVSTSNPKFKPPENRDLNFR